MTGPGRIILKMNLRAAGWTQTDEELDALIDASEAERHRKWVAGAPERAKAEERARLYRETGPGLEALEQARREDERERWVEIRRLERLQDIRGNQGFQMLCMTFFGGGILAAHFWQPGGYAFLLPFAASLIFGHYYVRWCNHTDALLKELEGRRRR